MMVVETNLSLIERARNWPQNKDDPVPPDDVLSLQKLLAEGALEEQKVVLGWLIDTRRFIVKIPAEKAVGWKMDIDILIDKIEKQEWITTKEWQSIY